MGHQYMLSACVCSHADPTRTDHAPAIRTGIGTAPVCLARHPRACARYRRGRSVLSPCQDGFCVCRCVGRYLASTTARCSRRAAWGGASCLQRGPSPSDPRPLSAEAWEAMLAAGRRETAARAHALALQQTDTPREAMQWVWVGVGADEVAKRRVELGLQGCYRERYGDARPAADREHDWDGM